MAVVGVRVLPPELHLCKKTRSGRAVIRLRRVDADVWGPDPRRAKPWAQHRKHARGGSMRRSLSIARPRPPVCTGETTA